GGVWGGSGGWGGGGGNSRDWEADELRAGAARAPRAPSLQRCRCDPLGDRTQRAAAAAALGMGLEHGELRVGGCARADDGTASVDLGGGAEGRGVGRGGADHGVEHFGYRHGTILGRRGGLNAL